MQKIIFIALATLMFFPAVSQVKDISTLDQEQLDWQNSDPKGDKEVGVSTEKAYNSFLAGKTSKKTIIVAVIDSGVDIEHEDLQGKIWINEDEIPNNGKDDDNNGYVDDVNGWNFIGNANGENLHEENLEYVRICKEDGTGRYSKEYLEKAKKRYNDELNQKRQEQMGLSQFVQMYEQAKQIIKDKTGIDPKTTDDLDKINSDDAKVNAFVEFLRERFEQGLTDEILTAIKHQNEVFIKSYLNLNFHPRKIVGDDPYDINDTGYGNNDVTGPGASHGTGVAGLIAANRNNGIGINGIATDVKIMAIRSTPDGDERDKDVALAIRYAVDNGADIINMSFGKDFSPQKSFVDAAVKYADEKGVLLVHAAGNDGKDIDVEDNFPNIHYEDGGKAQNWMTIGASAIDNDEQIAAIFSNYGQKDVDIFAPGHDIISLDTANTYSMNSGTSFAAPVVAGVAALVWSYYPELSVQELIAVLKKANFNLKKKKVLAPSEGETRDEVRFGTLSQTGGIINAYKALKLAKKKAK